MYKNFIRWIVYSNQNIKELYLHVGSICKQILKLEGLFCKRGKWDPYLFLMKSIWFPTV